MVLANALDGVGYNPFDFKTMVFGDQFNKGPDACSEPSNKVKNQAMRNL